MDKRIIIGYVIVLVIMGIFTLSLYAKDKKYAIKNKWRIKESTLLLSTFLFGSLGALIGIYGLRHKNRHWYFILILFISLIWQLGLLGYFISL